VLVSDRQEFVVSAPEQLVVGSRSGFRSQALDLVDRAALSRQDIVIDLSRTAVMDSNGLGLLVLVENRARERGLRVILRQPGEAVRKLLSLARLESLFRVES
jgi:anti-anti-sigma factor